MSFSLSAMSFVVFGFGLGLRHAIEADHLAAVSTIVSERKSILSASLVGGIWGIGHTISLMIAGLAVILLQVEIGELAAQILEFCVAIMLVALGVNTLIKLARDGHIHVHSHRHGQFEHLHPHLHTHQQESQQQGHLLKETTEAISDSHHNLRLVARPLIVGMVHGLAGSAALMLLVLSTISSPIVGLAYIFFFGLGSIGGMMLMSALVSLPVRLTATRYAHAPRVMRCLAGLFSLSFGLFMAYKIGIVEGLLGR